MATPLKILSTARRRVFEDVPSLSREEGIGFTALDSSSRKVTSAMRTDVNKVGFLVQRAYFQAKGRFFSPDKYKPVHQRMAERALGLKKSVNLSEYNAKTASHHRAVILDMYGWKRYGAEDRAALKEHALLLVDKQKDSEVVLFSLLDFCWRNKTEVPGYNEFAEIISQAYTDFETSLLNKIASNITEEQKHALLSLIDNPEIAANFAEIKRINQSTRQRKLNYNAELLKYFKALFFTAKPLLDELKLSTEAIKHFSGQVLKSTLSQLRNIRDAHKKCLLIMAFVQDQYFLRQDYGVDAFLKQIRATLNQGKKYNQALKEKDEKELYEVNSSVLASSKNATHILRLIVDISKNPLISLAEKNEKVLRLAESYFEAENPDLVDHIARLETNLANYDLNINLNHYIFGRSDSLQRSYSPIIRLLEFDENNSVPVLIEAITAFKDDNFEITESTPTGFLSEKDKKLVFLESSVPVISRYKVKLFVAIEQAIRRRRLTLKYSYRYGASQTYLISDEQWRLKADEFIRAAGLQKYRDGKAVVYSLGRLLTEAYETVNARYLRGENSNLLVDRKGTWSLKKPEPDFDASKYIPQLLSESKAILLYEVLCEIDGYTEFSESFKHHSLKHSAKSTQSKLIYGTLMSLGTNLGHVELARAARGLSEKQLRDTEKLWFNEQSLERANQTIVRFIQSLPLPTIYNTIRNEFHTSSDGKKVVVAVNSLLANYSYKYYGKEQGVTVNSFLDEKQSFFHVNVMTSSDREAPYMMDGLVKSVPAVFHEPYLDETGFREGRQAKGHKHSTDTHGYTEAIFAGLHFLDVAYAPRIADVADQTIYAFEARSLRKNTSNPIAPNSTINKKLILDNWDGILRVMATIKLNYCSASLMLRMLSAGGADSPLYAALKEFGRLIKSKFILNYIDDEELRRAITKQLNRVELGQKMAGAVFYGRSGQFHVGTSDEIQRVMLCKTILQNAIILWNYLFLSDYYNGLDTEEEKRVVSEMISKGSVIAWKHINMKGIFDFDHEAPNSFRSTIKQMLGLEIVRWEQEEEAA